MKVIFVTREGYNLAGARVRAYNFAKALKDRGVKAEVLSYAEDLGAGDGIYESRMTFLEKIKYNISAYKRLSKEKDAIIVLQRVNYHAFSALAAKILKKNRIILDMDDWEIREDPGYLFGFYPTSKAEYLTRKIAGLSELCVAGSLYLKEYISRFNKKVYYIPSCVDTDRFRPKGELKEKNVIKFTWTGTLHRRDDVENVIFIIDCFKDLKNSPIGVSLDIVGDGIYCQEAVRYLSGIETRHKIDFKGWIHPDRMPEYLEDVDIGLFPLMQDTRFNNAKSPTKLFEYMSMGKPTVSSRTGEAVSIIEDGSNGFLAKDKEEFMDRMRMLANNWMLRLEMGNNARRRVLEGYSMNSAGDRLFSIFRNGGGPF